MLDSGSAISIIGMNCHKKVLSDECTIFKDDLISATAAGGQSMRSIGYVLLPLLYNGKSNIVKLHIIPEVNIPLLLGIDFWKKFNLMPKQLADLEFHSPSDPTVLNIIENSDLNLINSYEHLDNEQKLIADNIIKQFESIAFETKGLGRTSLIQHKIDTGDSLPIKQRYYRMSPEKQRIISEQVKEMLDLDVIEPCESPWSSPVLVVGKKDGKPRFCLDSRKLNSVTKKDAYNLPYVSEILDNLKEAKFLSSIDLSKAFWQIPISPQDREKTAFYVPGHGTMQFKVTAFGLSNAPATQQRLVDMLFGPEFELKVFCYLDDIIITSATYSEHTSLLLRVLEKLKKANLTINLEKSKFFRNQLKYLGYVVDGNGLHTDPEKVEAILRFPPPTNKKEVKRFLGTASWYRRFVPNFSTVAGPLNKLTSTKKGKSNFEWTAEAESSFQQLKNLLSRSPVLACPNFSLPFEVHTDASDYGLGAMLAQTIDGVEHPIAYMSKSLTGPERNYSVTEREALAVLVALEHWRCYLENGKTFTVFTDHAALRWFLSLSNPSGRLARWGVRLSSFQFEIKHRKGTDNIIPDALSRSVPLAEVSLDINPLSTIEDKWYLDIFNGCKNSPERYLNYRIENNNLYRHVKDKSSLTSEFNWKQVIPKEQRVETILKNHADPLSAHMGVFKTYRRLLLKFYWPGMYADVVDTIAKCETCLAYKHATQGTMGKMGRPKVCSRPFQTLSIDLVGPLPTSRKQNNYILVVTCCFSKYCLVFPLRQATAKAICRHIEDSVILIHGVPQTVIMDNGPQFISHELTALFNKYKIPNIHYTPKYTPQVNTVERYNKTIVTAIATLISNDHRAWDTQLPYVQFAINNSVNEVTGYTPAMLVHGRELVTCGSHYTDNDLPGELLFSPRDIYAENLGHLSTLFSKVQTALYESHIKNTQRYNLRRKFVEFNVGDIVWKRTFYQSDKDAHFAKKLAPKFDKCKVVSKRSPLVYILEDSDGKNIGAWHIKDLKRKN